MATKEPITVKCPCGTVIHVRPKNNEYDLMAVKCSQCGSIPTHCNGRTGEVFSWMTPAQVSRANAEYQDQLHSADMNEFYGRGNW